MNKLPFALLIAATPAVASAMDVATFLSKAEALQKKGAMAVFSSDLKPVMNEVKATGAAMKAERLADVKAGRRPDYCPPAKASSNSNELLAYLRTIPPAQRSMSFKAAMTSFMAKKYPCPA